MNWCWFAGHRFASSFAMRARPRQRKIGKGYGRQYGLVDILTDFGRGRASLDADIKKTLVMARHDPRPNRYGKQHLRMVANEFQHYGGIPSPIWFAICVTGRRCRMSRLWIMSMPS